MTDAGQTTLPPNRKLGRLPNDPSKPRIKYAALFRGGTIPTDDIPVRQDWTKKVSSYPMFLNDTLGDCTCAAAGHMLETWTADVSTEATVTDDQVLTAYEAVSGYDPKTGAHDDGAVMQDVLDYWRKTGIAGHKIVAFAEIDVHDLNAVRHAIHTFGQVYVGMNFPAFAMDQFNNGQPWDVSTHNAQIEGGHCIPSGEYDSTKKTLTVVTWGARQVMTEAFWAKYVEECWVPITMDWIDQKGISGSGVTLAALGYEYTLITGKPSPFPNDPTPSPQPTPTPTPEPVDPPADLDQALAVALFKYLHANHDKPHYLAGPAYAWLAANTPGTEA